MEQTRRQNRVRLSSVNASRNVPSCLQPPDAITGIFAFSETRLVSSISYPAFVPSQSILVSNISPAPSSSAFFRPFKRINSGIHTAAVKVHIPTALIFTFLRQSHRQRTVCRIFSAASLISSGRFIAALLTATLSAPALRIFLKSSTVRIPPPTVNGINTCFATASTISTTVSRASDDAVMSRKTSSRPHRLYHKPLHIRQDHRHQ